MKIWVYTKNVESWSLTEQMLTMNIDDLDVAYRIFDCTFSIIDFASNKILIGGKSIG